MKRFSEFALCCLLIAGLTAPLTHAQDTSSYSIVSIAADNEMGVGYAVAKGSDCLVVTARHVVFGGKITSEAAQAGSITVTDTNKISATTSTVLISDVSADLAVLKLTPPKEFNCRSTWQDGAELAGALDTAMTDETKKFYVVSLSNDSKTSVPGTLNQLDGASRFSLNANVVRGNSGSPVIYNGNKIAGILLSTSLDNPKPAPKTAKGAKPASVAAVTPTAVVLRQDYIHALVKDLVKVDGTTIMLTPVMSGTDSIEIANAAVRQFFETQPKIHLVNISAQDIDGTGNITNFHGADFVFQGRFLQLAMKKKKSWADRARDLGNVLSDVQGLDQLGSALNSAGSIGNAVSDEDATWAMSIKTEYVLYDVKTAQSFTQLATFAGQEKGDISTALGAVLEKSITDALPKLMTKAGLEVAGAAAAAPAAVVPVLPKAKPAGQ